MVTYLGDIGTCVLMGLKLKKNKLTSYSYSTQIVNICQLA